MTLTATNQNSTTVATIPFHGTNVQSVEIDGSPQIVFKPLVESIGLAYSSQIQKLKKKSWAAMSLINTTGADGKSYQMTVIDLRTLTMWLATIDENRVSEEARPLVIAYQSEIADVVDAYWTRGGAINPRAGLDAETLIEKFALPRSYQEALLALASSAGEVEALTVENTAYKGGDGIRIKDFIKTYFVAPNERRIFEWFYFHGFLIDGRMRDDDGRASRSGSSPKMRWDHMHPSFIGRQFFKLVPNPNHPHGGRKTRIIPENVIDLVGLLLRAPDLNVQMTEEGRHAADRARYINPNQLRLD